MSVLIKGMDMPKSCGECDICAADFMWFHCPVGKQADGRVLDLENHKDEFIYTESRHPDCPLREIPTPHGRLVDADELMKVIKEYDDEFGNEIEHGRCVSFSATVLEIPTIIEAEGIE